MRELGSKYVVEHIKGVAADKGMHHPEDAVFRFERQCKYDWDSHEVVVIDSDKSVGDLFDAFLAERKDALKSTGTSGAGSRVGEVSVSTDSAPTDDLSKVWGPYQR